MDVCPIVKVKPWGKDQGDFVEINLSDYDPKIHTVVDGDLPVDLDGSGDELPPASDEEREASAPAKKPAAKRRRGR